MIDSYMKYNPNTSTLLQYAGGGGAWPYLDAIMQYMHV